MKRNTKAFSVEIKKSRVHGQRQHLPPRPLFETPPDKATKVVETGEPQGASVPSSAPRILHSIVELVWSTSEAVPPARKRSSGTVNQEQIELDLIMSTFEDVTEAQSAVPELSVATAEQDAACVNDGQPAQRQDVKANARKTRTKTSSDAEQREVLQPSIGIEQIPEPEMTWPPAVSPMNPVERRLTRRQSAATQLPRHERWKRRLHPASW
jgi:hypothetical protein